LQLKISQNEAISMANVALHFTHLVPEEQLEAMLFLVIFLS